MIDVLENIIDALIPIGICVVLPILVVWINNKRRQNETNRQTEIILKAIEKGVEIHPELFNSKIAENISLKERLLKKFTWGTVIGLCGALLTIVFIALNVKATHNNMVELSYLGMIFSGVILSIGAALLISYYVGRKTLAKEIEAEECAKSGK